MRYIDILKIVNKQVDWLHCVVFSKDSEQCNVVCPHTDRHSVTHKYSNDKINAHKCRQDSSILDKNYFHDCHKENSQGMFVVNNPSRKGQSILGIPVKCSAQTAYVCLNYV